jgi:hypothetical protein
MVSTGQLQLSSNRRESLNLLVCWLTFAAGQGFPSKIFFFLYNFFSNDNDITPPSLLQLCIVVLNQIIPAFLVALFRAEVRGCVTTMPYSTGISVLIDENYSISHDERLRIREVA